MYGEWASPVLEIKNKINNWYRKVAALSTLYTSTHYDILRPEIVPNRFFSNGGESDNKRDIKKRSNLVKINRVSYCPLIAKNAKPDPATSRTFNYVMMD